MDEEARHLNYKKVILAVAIAVAIVLCVYIGLILPNIVKNPIENTIDNTKEQQNNEISNLTEVELEPEPILEPTPEPEPVVQEVKPYPINTPVAIEKMKNIYESSYKRVFLTFDDGPSQTVTPQILNILDTYNVKATFFVLGSRVEIYPELVREEFNRGHYVANHGYSHRYDSIYSSTNAVLNEYWKTEGIIREALGKPDYYSNVFRFPGGSNGGKYANLKANARNVLEQNNISYLDWNCLTRDAEGSFNKEQLIQNLIDTSQDKISIVVLMHDAGTKITTYEALPNVIEYFQNNGYVFETIYNILEDQ